jgi:Flp pilus assembly protein TadD
VACALAALWLLGARDEHVRVRAAVEANAADRPREALRQTDEAVRGTAAGRALAERAYAQARLGRLGDAAVTYRRALRHRPNDWVLHRDLAIVLARLGRTDAAARSAARAAELNPRG